MNAVANLPQTMTSREIAELVDSRHDKVKQSIERLAARGLIAQPPMGDGPKAANGVVEKHYLIGKRDSYIIVAQLSPEFTARLVDRWQELEARAVIPVPGFAIPTNLAQALRLAADKAEEAERANAALAIAAPKAEALDLISASDESVTLTEAAKLLGVKREKLTSWMHANGWVYRQNGRWLAHQVHINNGRLQYKESKYTDQRTGYECFSPYCHILPKGLTKLATAFSAAVAA